MNKSHTFNFNSENFNRIFPFYILLNEHLEVESLGNSIQKVDGTLKKGVYFPDYFSLVRPHSENISQEILVDNLSQLVILESKKQSEFILRGQFEPMENNFLFVGSPWLMSVEEIKTRKLSIFDFANHDPLLDLLQILKTQETTTQELKELLRVNNEQKNALKTDREELNKLSVVASANENAIVFTHPNAQIFWCNDAYLRLTGFSREEIMGRTPIEVGLTESTDREALQKMMDLFYTGESFDVEITHGRKDGSYFWTRTKGQPIYDDNGNVLQYFAMIEDMTEVKEKEEQLVLLSLIAEKNINSVVICDKEGQIEWVNSSFEQMSGYTKEELIGQKPGILLQGPDSHPETVTYLSNQIKKGEPFNCEIVNYSKSNKKYWVKIQGQALYNNWGEIVRFFAIEEDITDKKLLESQKEVLLKSLAKSNKELEDYAQIVSHDLKSPLRSINSLVAWIKEDNEGALTEQTTQYLNMIEDKLEKMDHLIQGVLTYSKIDKTDIAKENVNIHEVVSNIISIIHIPQHTKVEIKNTLPVLKADRFRIQQLFQNLISNAVNYIDKEEGLVSIDVEEAKDCFIFSVRDNGPGIAEENQEKIFKIFQSFSKSEKSTGLGLSIVKKIVDNYGGKIWIESELGSGTVFYIKLYK
ncbi:PAS domain S-box protein [Flavobacterium rakeshii]|uniref:PAS domain S-box protein n=1 Tax=Flavobacterium rakeshii TaxID=1038845 RepID=A0A6N8HEQ6_9FLAO|nr:PAS domain-containing protein [Flavobacterium rakeshii]MUV03968.1 PAS domain S-box protein [Flavobacterium rakeshii]